MKPWDLLLKRMLWQQLDFVQGMTVLDFGSGKGETASHLAVKCRVVAVEPSPEMLAGRVQEHAYTQIEGSVEQLFTMPDGLFDVVLCHNVLEYVPDRALVLRELTRVLRPGGVLSVCKHNRAGRVMQMAVLLNDFEHAHALLDGKGGVSSQFGAIGYYENEEITALCPGLRLENMWGCRTFWDLQQNQLSHSDPAWQEEMLRLEMRVSQMPAYREVAFFHHLLFRKNGGTP